MSSKTWTVLTSLTAFLGVLCLTVNLSAEPADAKKSQSQQAAKAEEEKPLTVAQARERAKLTHEIYTATLDVMHHRYFLDDKATIPARAMEDVFRKIQRKSNISARWISINTKAMSIDHDPETAFEKKAARTLGRGKGKGKHEMEIVEDGYYRHVGTIRLTGGCIGCHVAFGADPNIDRFAGLVISIPVSGE